MRKEMSSLRLHGKELGIRAESGSLIERHFANIGNAWPQENRPRVFRLRGARPLIDGNVEIGKQKRMGGEENSSHMFSFASRTGNLYYFDEAGAILASFAPIEEGVFFGNALESKVIGGAKALGMVGILMAVPKPVAAGHLTATEALAGYWMRVQLENSDAKNVLDNKRGFGEHLENVGVDVDLKCTLLQIRVGDAGSADAPFGMISYPKPIFFSPGIPMPTFEDGSTFCAAGFPCEISAQNVAVVEPSDAAGILEIENVRGGVRKVAQEMLGFDFAGHTNKTLLGAYNRMLEKGKEIALEDSAFEHKGLLVKEADALLERIGQLWQPVARTYRELLSQIRLSDRLIEKFVEIGNSLSGETD